MSARRLSAFALIFGLVLPSCARAALQPPAANPAPTADAAYPLLDRIFKAELLQEQLAALGPEAAAETAAAAFTPDQKSSALLALRRLEPDASPSDLKQIRHGYELLGMWAEALRVEAFPPNPQAAALKNASQALKQGDNERAALLASDILARDPLNKEANAILRMSKRYVPDAELEQIKLNPTAPQDRAVLGYMLQAGSANGDHDKLLRLALDAMRADPTSPLAHAFYNSVNEQRAKHIQILRESYSYVQEAKQALARGDKMTALVWAQKAADADISAAARGYLESVRNAEPGKKATMTAQPIATLPKKEDGGSLFWPFAGAAAAVLALGGAAMAYGDRAAAWAKDHPYLAVTGGVVIVGTAALLVAGAAGGGAVVTTTGIVYRAGAAYRAARIGKPAVDTGISLLAGKAAADGISKSVKTAEPSSAQPSVPPQPAGVPVLLPLPVGSQQQNDCSIKPAEDVLDRFVDGTRLAPKFLDRHEGEGGHTKGRHVKKPIPYLIKRLKAKEAASSFLDQPTAEAIIRGTVVANEAAIRSWASHPSDDLKLEYVGTQVIGYGVTLEKPVLPQNKTNARMYLNMRTDCRILIVSAYPE